MILSKRLLERIVTYKMQSQFRYILKEPDRMNFSTDIEPELTSKQMVELVVSDRKSKTGCTKEFPSDPKDLI